MFACPRPVYPGASPRNCTVAFAPPMVAVAVAVAEESGESGVAVPSATALSSAPCPVRYTTSTAPEATGSLSEFVELSVAF